MPEREAPTTLGHGRYRIEQVLGSGGTAVVYLATDTRMGVQRAIKLLNAEFARSAQSRARFLNEARAQAGLKHPNVVMVHDVIEDEQGLYMVMELAESDSVGARVTQSGTLSAREVADVGVAVGNALSAAHAAGVIHRDVKPANILVDRLGALKLADFGIARVLDREQQLTRTGTIMGTWAYMPPEQREETREVDHRADIYALGVTLHALYTGRHSANLHNQEYYAEAFGDMPGPLAEVIQRATRLFPEDRYQQADAFVAALASIAADLPGPPFQPSGAPHPAPAGAQAAPDRPPPGAAAPEAPRGVTAVPLHHTHQTVLPPEAEAPPTTGTPRAAPMRSDTPPASRTWLLMAGLLVFTLVATGGALLVPRVFDGTDGAADVTAGAPAAPAPPSVGPPSDGDAAPAAQPPAGSGAPDDPGATPAPAAQEDPAAAPGEPTPAPTVAADAPAAPAPSPRAAPPPAPRRIIRVRPSGEGAPPPAPAAGTPTSAPDADDLGPTGAVLLRTIPSGATLSRAGLPLTGAGGRYTLPVGSHLLDLRSPAGEVEMLPVTIKAGETVSICFNFDTNQRCEGAP